MKRNLISVAIFVFFYISFGLLVSYYQEWIIYKPDNQDFASCSSFVLAEKRSYNGTRFYFKEGEKGLVVLYHGNTGSACDRSIYADLFVDAGYGYAIVEYAGYSNDTERPSHERIQSNVEDIVTFLQSIAADRILVVGESIGTGPASLHASLSSPDGLLLITPFYDLIELAKDRFWFYPVGIMVDNAFDNHELLQRYQGPVTIIHGTEDQVVSYDAAKQLFESLSTKERTFHTKQGYGHNNLFASEEFYAFIKNFLK